jgi:hypothetical protein
LHIWVVYKRCRQSCRVWSNQSHIGCLYCDDSSRLVDAHESMSLSNDVIKSSTNIWKSCSGRKRVRRERKSLSSCSLSDRVTHGSECEGSKCDVSQWTGVLHIYSKRDSLASCVLLRCCIRRHSQRNGRAFERCRVRFNSDLVGTSCDDRNSIICCISCNS